MGDPHGTALHDEKDGVCIVLDSERLGKPDRLGKNSCEQMLLQLFLLFVLH